jgi:Caudovirus prohead protease.
MDDDPDAYDFGNESDDEHDEALAALLAELDPTEMENVLALARQHGEVGRAHIGWKPLVAELMAKGHSKESAARIAHAIAVRKYGPERLLAMSRAGRAAMKAGNAKDHVGRARYGNCWCGQIARSTGFCSEHATFDRTWALSDIEIVRSGAGGDGRTVDAYAAVFSPIESEIRDQYGHYRETIHRAAFDLALGSRDLLSKVTVLHNHGMTLDGAPAPLGSIPIGVPVDIRADGRGLLTRTRYVDGDYADAVLAAIKSGAIKSYSFRGRVFQSNPDRVPRIQRGGTLPLITRTKLGLVEYGPSPTAYYPQAAVVAVRSAVATQALADLRHMPLRERIEVIARAFGEPVDDITDLAESDVDEVEDAPATPEPPEVDPADASLTPSDEGPETEDPAPDEPLPPVIQAARSMSAAEVARKARVAMILRGM